MQRQLRPRLVQQGARGAHVLLPWRLPKLQLHVQAALVVVLEAEQGMAYVMAVGGLPGRGNHCTFLYL